MFEIILQYLHLLAAIVWIGGTAFVFTSLVPVLKQHVDPRTRIAIMKAVGRKFALISWIAISVLLITGIFKVIIIAAGGEDQTGVYWYVLGFKLALVLIAVIFSFLHDFVFGPRISNPRENDNPQNLRRAVIAIARSHFFLLLIIAFLGVYLAYLRIAH